jgi:TonB family protein
MIAVLVTFAPQLTAIPAARSLNIIRDRVTELIAPPRELTQRAPNQGPRQDEFTVESIRPRSAAEPSLPNPGSAPTPAIPGKQFKLPQMRAQNTPSASLPEAPDIDVARVQAPPPGLGVQTPQIAPPQIQTEEKPKLAFERPGATAGTPGQTGTVQVPKPRLGVEEAVRQAARGGGNIVIGDEDGGSAPIPGLAPSPSGGKLGSNLELLSDPQGVDFRPYLLRVLSSVRRNWFSVIPESARYGRQGKVLVRFSITRDGNVQRFEITGPSGTEALDRAAVAGISASQPFPPLPGDFKGGWIRLQLTFLYNIK